MANVIERKDGKISQLTNIRLTDDELEFLATLEEHQDPRVRRRGTGPAVHRLIGLARGWDALLAGPLREYLKREGMTVEEFAELAELEVGTVRDILTLETRQPDYRTVAKIRAVIGD
jgi:hypothetical protein